MLQILLDNVVSNIKLSSRSNTDGKGERRKGIRVRTFEHWELEVIALMGLGVETPARDTRDGRQLCRK